MTRSQSKDISLIVTSFFMKTIGFWEANNRTEQCRKNFALGYTVTILSLAIIILAMDTYHTWGEFNQCIYEICNMITLGLVLCKIIILFVNRKKFSALLRYAQKNFWHSNYDNYESELLNNCKRTCSFLICVFSFFAEGTAINYVLVAVVENIGKTGIDRVLPFSILSFPSTMTPYFEILFTIQACGLMHIGVCYLSVDNFLCVINLHVACQFRILQYRFESTDKIIAKEKENKSLNKGSSRCASQYYATFKNCIKQHQALIAFCNNLEEIFTLIILGQVLLFSLLICLDGYLIGMQDAPILKRLVFVFHVCGCMCQLLMFTYSCDCLIQESTGIASSVYSVLWPVLPMTRDAKELRKDLTFVMLRSRVPCCLTAYGFFAVSLETYTRVLSTAVSYFTLLRQY